MPTVTCPNCSRPVTLPTAGDVESWVRCPLCRGEYRLKEALDYSPPALEVIPNPTAIAGAAPATLPVIGFTVGAPIPTASSQSVPELLTEPGHEFRTAPERELLGPADEQADPASGTATELP